MRKKRSTTAKRRTTTKKSSARRTTQRKRSNPFLMPDIAGVASIVFGLATAVALFTETSSGAFGRIVTAALYKGIGYGAFVLPVLCVMFGVMLIVGPLKIISRNIGIGSLMLFMVIITWASLANVGIGGGMIGNIPANLLYRFAGEMISYIILFGIALVAAVIIVDVPLSVLVDKIRTIWLDWKDAVEAKRDDTSIAASNEKPVRVKDNSKEEPAEDKRKRSFAELFAREAVKEPVEGNNAPDLELVKPPVKITTVQPVKASRNGVLKDLTPVEEGEYVLPPTSLLNDPPPPPPRVESELKENIEIIERTLSEFKVEANVVEIAHGPTVARYEIRLAPGIKVNKIVTLADNLAMQLSAIAVRVEAPIPGKPAIGVEVPNRERGTVVLREIVESKAFLEAKSGLAFALGKDVSGKAIVSDLYKMPHLLIGGATGSGKSVGLNTLIMSLLFRTSPDDLKLVLIDPKRVELALFDGIPHLACPVVKDVKQAAGIFRAVVQEMESRYGLLARVGAKNIDSYNQKVGKDDKMPYMVVVVDELCDLMMQCAAEVEGSITRIAQLARATGIHLVIATQRPSVDVITGLIKVNVPSRIAFGVSSHHDSRTILDAKGAESLIGRGDMLFLPMDASKPVRIQGCYVSENEIDAVCKFIKDQRKPVYTITPAAMGEGGGSGGGEGDDSFADEFYEPSVRFVVSTGYCSTSMLQRKFKIGYTRAARIVDYMEEQGIVGPLDGAGTKGRQVLVSKMQLEEMFGGKLGFAPDAADDDENDDEDVPSAEVSYPEDEEQES